MTNEFPRSRFSVAGMGISDDARKTMNAAIDAFSDWREELAESSEKNGNAVFDQMAAAAKAFGWPSEFVDLTRQQMQNASKMQLQLMDQVMEVWEQQLKNSGANFKMPEAWTSAMKNFQSAASMSPFPGMPNIPGMPGLPGMGALGPMAGFGNMTANPIQFWMQAMEMWQKSWQQAMQTWADAQSNMTGKSR